ncbi:Mediator of RNA polymerase II transcription subunit 10 [Penicillium cataractarum]|uniref:Mediator of RNA polymerase II transcription subunit 10 n=1 Tax=Penicillium cataractarum TaxID=2100454 RepID=A0A9W9RR80_9EURO|nr:Mediator of RNA polymerase II transcription subunit 10 [Penicillium cataractarum]KAJ5364200.1 Mediator of RNA polymerase II transcription subunit 10 [Penicillium cataractarum]
MKWSMEREHEANLPADDIRDVIQHLFEIQSAVHGYLGPETQQELVRKMYVRMIPAAEDISMASPFQQEIEIGAIQALRYENRTKTSPSLSQPYQHIPPLPPNAAETITSNNTSDPSNPPLASIQLPPEIIEYVDAARNPDIYTREFVELVQRGNQDLKGKREAFADFRDVLAREMRSAMPECRGEVDRVVSMTGGKVGGEDGVDGASK